MVRILWRLPQTAKTNGKEKCVKYLPTIYKDVEYGNPFKYANKQQIV